MSATGNFKFLIKPESKIILVKFYGSIRYADMLNMMKSVLTANDYMPDCNLLFDFRNATAMWFRLDVIDFAKEYKKYVSFEVNKKYAYLYNTTNFKISIPIFKTLTQISNLKINCLKSCNEALDWLMIEKTDREWINNFLKN